MCGSLEIWGVMRSRNWRGFLAAKSIVTMAVVGAVLLVEPTEASADVFARPGFSTEVVATVSPFTLVGLDFAPDGRLFVWQKNGVIRIIKNGVLLPTPFLD